MAAFRKRREIHPTKGCVSKQTSIDQGFFFLFFDLDEDCPEDDDCF